MITQSWWDNYRKKDENHTIKNDPILTAIINYFNKNAGFPSDILKLYEAKNFDDHYIIPAMICYVSQYYFDSDFEFKNLFTNAFYKNCRPLIEAIEPGTLKIEFNCQHLLVWGNQVESDIPLKDKLQILALLINTACSLTNQKLKLEIFFDFTWAEDCLNDEAKLNIFKFAQEIQSEQFRKITLLGHHAYHKGIYFDFTKELANTLKLESFDFQSSDISLPNFTTKVEYGPRRKMSP